MRSRTFIPEPTGPSEIDDDALDGVVGGGRSHCEGDDGIGTGTSKPSGSSSTIVFVGGYGSASYQY